MEEDDMDFTPSQNTNSNLASLFEFTKKPLLGNSSLTYTAPKAPKGDSSLAKKPTEDRTKSQIIFSKAVHAYKLEKRTYVSQGLIGMVISGNHDSRMYEIILYKRNKQHLCQIRISYSFSIILSPNNYVSFHDNNQKNWSLMFQSTGDVEQFSQKVAICKFYSQPEPHTEALIQDSTPHSQLKASLNSTVDVVYSSYALIPEEISKLKGEINEKIKLSNCTFLQFSKSLIGCSENSKRIIIIPHSLSGPWLNELNPKKDLLLDVKLERILPESENLGAESKALKDGPESPTYSSAEETNVKARGASIKEALSTTKSQKANLISRMARMGQATLPVKPGLSTEQSDSEEENLLTSSPKHRIPKSRVSASSPSVNSSFSQTTYPAEASHQLSVYQNDLWHQSQMSKQGVVYQQLIPASASPMLSPTTDPNLSVYVSESRIQATELRMGISKISEKLDLIWNKVQNTGGAGTDSKMNQIALMDSEGILKSVQNLIAENECLKEKVEEQKGKLEQQNDRIFHLLELNHKYLERNSTTHEMQSANELKLRTEMDYLQKKEMELEASSRRALDKARSLAEDLAKSEEDKKELKRKLEEVKAEAEALKRDVKGLNNDSRKDELESLTGELSKSLERINKLEERLREIVSENDRLKHVIKTQKEEIETGNLEMKDSETKKKEYEKAVESLKKQISDEGLKTESKIDNLLKVVAKLKEENKCLLAKVEKQGCQSDVKDVFAQILSALKEHFSDSKEYSASEILTAASKIFKDVIEGTFEEQEKKSEATSSETLSPPPKHEVVPAPRKSRQNAEPAEKEKEEREATGEVAVSGLPGKESEGKEEEKSGTDGQKKKEENDSRYKSYDQGWRTTRPPPPPLFDDEDDTDDWLN